MLAEPGGTPIGSAIRELILNPDIPKLPETELDLFFIARHELVQQVLDPAIQRGAVVVGDRNWFSSVAYQGFGRQMDVHSILEKSRRAMGDYFIPTGSVIIDIPPDVAEERLRGRGVERDWFENEHRGFFDRVRQGYQWIAEQYDIEVIDGSGSPEDVSSAIWNCLGYIALS
jgi:dTMP kinase